MMNTFFIIQSYSPLFQLYGAVMFWGWFVFFLNQVFILNMSLKRSCSESAEFIQGCQHFSLTVSVGHINL